MQHAGVACLAMAHIVMAYAVMAGILMACTVMAHEVGPMQLWSGVAEERESLPMPARCALLSIVSCCVRMVMAHVVMAYIERACTVMAYIGVAYIVMAFGVAAI